MSYLKKQSLLQQQQELRELVDTRLKNEEFKVKERVYQWLSENQYFTDNELYDFYFCVAQNIAAVEVLGRSGDKIVQAKKELDESAKTFTTQIVDTHNWIEAQLESQLNLVLKNQQELETQLVQTIKILEREKKNLDIISNGLINSITTLMAKQKNLLFQTKKVRELVFNLVIINWTIVGIVLLGCLFVFLLG